MADARIEQAHEKFRVRQTSGGRHAVYLNGALMGVHSDFSAAMAAVERLATGGPEPAPTTARDRLQAGLDALTDAEADHLLAGLHTARGMAAEGIAAGVMPDETRVQLAALVKLLEVGK